MFVMRIATVVALLLGSLAQPLMGSDCAKDMTASGSSQALHAGHSGHPGHETVEGHSSNGVCSATTDHTHERTHHAPTDCVHAPCSASLVGATLGSAGSPMGSHDAPAHAFARSAWIDLSQDPPPPRLPS